MSIHELDSVASRFFLEERDMADPTMTNDVQEDMSGTENKAILGLDPCDGTSDDDAATLADSEGAASIVSSKGFFRFNVEFMIRKALTIRQILLMNQSCPTILTKASLDYIPLMYSAY